MEEKIFEYIIFYQTSGAGGMIVILQVKKELTYFPVIKNKQNYSSINTGGGFSNRFTINKKYLKSVEDFLKTQGIDDYDLLIESSDRLAMVSSEIMSKELPTQPVTLSLNTLNLYTHVKFIANVTRHEIKGDNIGSNHFTTCKIINKQVKILNNFSTGHKPLEYYFITFSDIHSNSSYENGYAFLNPDLSLKQGVFSINTLDTYTIGNSKEPCCKFQLFGNSRMQKIEEILKEDEK